jgi:hypothetical protein
LLILVVSPRPEKMSEAGAALGELPEVSGLPEVFPT